MTTLLVGTRKGLFTIHRGDAGWRLAPPEFAGEPVTQVLADAHTGAWYAALRLGHFGVKLRRSLDRGLSWAEMPAPAFPEKPKEGPWSDDATPWTVDLVWSLEAGPGRLWAGCLPAGLFHSDDKGASWQLVKSLWERPERKEWFGGGYDHAGIDSIAVDPRDAKRVTLAISCGGVWQTHDGGETWANTSEGLDAGAYMPPERRFDGNIQDVHRMDACAGRPDALWIQHHGGIFRSTDGANRWEAIASPKPSGFGFAVVVHPSDPDRAWFAPAHSDQNRVPVDGQMVVNETRDGGKTFITHRTGLPQKDAYHLVYRHAMACTPDGKTLAMGSTTGGLWVSEDEGVTWQCLSRDLPPIAVVRFGE
ncbi:MAG TPA: exo-alpha-sialidase [Ramlibacter sp.]|uniref:WD40/YVTN/BNR-like repeat-containing protein n=1 Tax=Ramlibacter sp. TaxID=1917967 RepID=UPI002CEB65E5|nr:exo-alpha-sialidase [Ramlibacter sp.]HVZ43199.1 exo-alpha-sialidase [Ramlibacter sp.]